MVGRPGPPMTAGGSLKSARSYSPAAHYSHRLQSTSRLITSSSISITHLPDHSTASHPETYGLDSTTMMGNQFLSRWLVPLSDWCPDTIKSVKVGLFGQEPRNSEYRFSSLKAAMSTCNRPPVQTSSPTNPALQQPKFGVHLPTSQRPKTYPPSRLDIRACEMRPR